MRLTADELKMHNDKVLRIAELRCEKSNIPGITVSFPDFMKGERSKVQLALPCGIIRDKKRKVNAMQVRTGAFTTSLAKEVTKYDDELGPEYQDNTDYMPFIPDGTGESVGDLISHDEAKAYTKDTKKPVRMKGILDL
jgi:hypothetical protein